MTQSLRAWLDERAEGVPPELLERIQKVIDSLGDAVAMEQSVRELSRVVGVHVDQTRHHNCVARSDALDLLTTDALVTYVLELSASLHPETLDISAANLMRLIVGPKHPQNPPAT